MKIDSEVIQMEISKILQTSQEVKFGKVLKFILPTYLTSLFNTLYTIIDGIYVSRYVSTNSLAAINTVYPLVNIMTGIALAFATGGSALAAIAVGAGDRKKADSAFSVSIISSILIGSLFSIIVLINLTPVLKFLGATPVTMTDCRIYGFLWLAAAPAVIGKELFTYFIRADGSPRWSFSIALSGGIFNIVLDQLFVAQLNMGIFGAGLATALGLVLSCAIGILYFAIYRKNLRFTIRHLPFTCGIRCMVNGLSECIDQLAIAVTTIVFNRTALMLAGENGIAAVSIIMYLQFLFIGVYFGYSMGISPLLGYALGNHKPEICRKLEQYSYRFFAAAPLMIYGLTYICAPFAVTFFAEKQSLVFNLALSGMRLYGINFLFSGFNIFAAVRLTSYGKGHYSGIITFLRSFALLLVFLIILPHFFGISGMWLAVPAAEAATFGISLLSVKKSVFKVTICMDKNRFSTASQTQR